MHKKSLKSCLFFFLVSAHCLRISFGGGKLSARKMATSSA